MFGLFLAIGLLVVPTDASPAFKVHPFPGGDTIASPWFAAFIGQQESFVWFTSVRNRQKIVPGNNIPHTRVDKDTSFTSFDLGAPTAVTIRLLNGTATTAKVLPSSANISAAIESSGTAISLTIDRPRQVCVVVNGNMNKPMCVFADPPEADAPPPPRPHPHPDSAGGTLIYFGPGVHAPGNITVTANTTVYLAGGAHVYGQVLARLPSSSSSCDGVRVHGRGVLDGRRVPIDAAAPAMLELPRCAGVRVAGVTLLDSPGYQVRVPAGRPGGSVRWAKAVAWGFGTDGWSVGAGGVVEDSFAKVNDDSCKLYATGSAYRRLVLWQMENGCPLMMSWNLNANVGFVEASDVDVIAHERTHRYRWWATEPDGLICAVHGGSGNLNDYLFDRVRAEGYEWGLVSIAIASNPWAHAAQLGNISTVLIRDLAAAEPFAGDDWVHISGNASYNAAARGGGGGPGGLPPAFVDRVVFEGATVAGRPLPAAAVRAGARGAYATNVTVCAAAEGCGDRILARGAGGWSKDQRCGRAPQPSVAGTQLPPLKARDLRPYCT